MNKRNSVSIRFYFPIFLVTGQYLIRLWNWKVARNVPELGEPVWSNFSPLWIHLWEYFHRTPVKTASLQSIFAPLKLLKSYLKNTTGAGIDWMGYTGFVSISRYTGRSWISWKKETRFWNITSVYLFCNFYLFFILSLFRVIFYV